MVRDIIDLTPARRRALLALARTSEVEVVVPSGVGRKALAAPLSAALWEIERVGRDQAISIVHREVGADADAPPALAAAPSVLAPSDLRFG